MSDGDQQGSSPSGVDRTQIERMLDLSPVARLELLEDWLDGIAELRDQLSREEDLGEAR
jgi:hypothetical protein